ncbi:uncharacterized protein LOC128675745 isoform X2 [Plodia interpunctella]|uniref:uncharacterized protein LOC128675745 isoform X2 n=1 Tax=Plodia interpunctella TaxID=58824 RepID=UPI0023683E54|nr:uncharacterized protein LOC128675745 isoform X2 [Plodia interpunctella]
MTMTTAVEGGASLAWRLLATLEGGSLLLATSALLAYTARRKVARKRHSHRRPVKSVLITNTTNELGQQLKNELESRGCTVSSVTDELMQNISSCSESRVDALVVVGAEPSTDCLNGMSEFVSQDVYSNLKVLETTSVLVRPGGTIVWACAGAAAGGGAAFSVAGAAFDAVIQAGLQHVAKSSRCEAVWLARAAAGDAASAARRAAAALLPAARPLSRNAVYKIGEYLDRMWKIIT